MSFTSVNTGCVSWSGQLPRAVLDSASLTGSTCASACYSNQGTPYGMITSDASVPILSDFLGTSSKFSCYCISSSTLATLTPSNICSSSCLNGDMCGSTNVKLLLNPSTVALSVYKVVIPPVVPVKPITQMDAPVPLVPAKLNPPSPVVAPSSGAVVDSVFAAVDAINVPVISTATTTSVSTPPSPSVESLVTITTTVSPVSIAKDKISSITGSEFSHSLTVPGISSTESASVQEAVTTVVTSSNGIQASLPEKGPTSAIAAQIAQSSSILPLLIVAIVMLLIICTGCCVCAVKCRKSQQQRDEMAAAENGFAFGFGGFMKRSNTCITTHENDNIFKSRGFSVDLKDSAVMDMPTLPSPVLSKGIGVNARDSPAASPLSRNLTVTSSVRQLTSFYLKN
ncbi:hypothetical protein BC830DRAFT_1173006 [Chytriomyces sp. MP71]|nr:hypothetical protein BC830DRAFT_1173006 [Chytriomyces sp. MP71]